MPYDDRFNDAFNYVLKEEGGYSNRKNDRGGPTNFGVTQRTYDWSRQRQGLPPKDVRNISEEEAKDIYYNDYWKASGANNMPSRDSATVTFDTAVLHGPSAAQNMYKKSGGNPNKMIDIRRQTYRQDVQQHPEQRENYSGWMNRAQRLENSIENNGFIPEAQQEVYKRKLDGNLHRQRTTTLNGFPTGYGAGIDESSIFTREDIDEMSQEEFNHYEPLINEQMEKVGIPFRDELDEMQKGIFPRYSNIRRY